MVAVRPLNTAEVVRPHDAQRPLHGPFAADLVIPRPLLLPSSTASGSKSGS
jgi:hypothetical protein